MQTSSCQNMHVVVSTCMLKTILIVLIMNKRKPTDQESYHTIKSEVCKICLVLPRALVKEASRDTLRGHSHLVLGARTNLLLDGVNLPVRHYSSAGIHKMKRSAKRKDEKGQGREVEESRTHGRATHCTIMPIASLYAPKSQTCFNTTGSIQYCEFAADERRVRRRPSEAVAHKVSEAVIFSVCKQIWQYPTSTRHLHRRKADNERLWSCLLFPSAAPGRLSSARSCEHAPELGGPPAGSSPCRR